MVAGKVAPAPFNYCADSGISITIVDRAKAPANRSKLLIGANIFMCKLILELSLLDGIPSAVRVSY